MSFLSHPTLQFAFTPRPRRCLSAPSPFLPCPGSPETKTSLLRPPPPSPTGRGVCVCVYVPPPPTHPRPARLRAAHSQLQPLFHALQATEPRFLLSWLRMTHFLPFPFPLPFSTHTPPPTSAPSHPPPGRTPREPPPPRSGAVEGGGRHGHTGNRRLVRAVFVFLSPPPPNARLRREDYTFIVAAE